MNPSCCQITLVFFSLFFTFNGALATDRPLTNVEDWVYEPTYTSKFDGKDGFLRSQSDGQAVENFYAESISRKFTAAQKAIAQGGQILRGTHAKGTCAKGEFLLFADDSEEISELSETRLDFLRSAPVFSSPGRIQDVKARHANADGRKNFDQHLDLRSLSLAITDSEGQRQDLLFNNVPRFQISNIYDFHLLMSFAQTRGAIDGMVKSSVGDFLNRRGLLDWLSVEQVAGLVVGAKNMESDVADILAKIGQRAAEDRKIADRYINQPYYTGVPFRLGAAQDEEVVSYDQVVKVGTYPCSLGSINHSRDLPESTLDAEDAKSLEVDYLQKGFSTDLFTGRACYRVYLQFLADVEGFDQTDPTAVELVEDAATVWHAPIFTIGEVRLKEPVSEASCDSSEFAMLPAENQNGLLGLGSIQRNRGKAEKSSLILRGGSEE